jgi:hypothetical protein
MNEATNRLLPPLQSRRDFFDYLDGYSVQAADELFQRHTTRGLVKTYMLETVRNGEPMPTMDSIFGRSGLQLSQVDGDGLFQVLDPRKGGAVALLEFLNDRHPVLYTLMTTDESDPWVRGLVDSTPWLDRLWLSARLFQELWRYVQTTASPRRYTRLTFEYEGLYEVDEGPAGEAGQDEDEDNNEVEPTLQRDDDDRPIVERRSSKFTMVDRVETVRQKLPDLQNTYRPLYSITQLRVPGSTRGGHDFYFDGKVTNRGDSFADHRQNVQFVLGVYRRVTERAESTLWVSAEEAGADQAGFNLKGAPVYLEFSEPLEQATFDRWVNTTFERKRNRFRLGGRPFRLSPGKVHVYGVDRHLWQPVLLEVTRRHIIAVLPKGTCGNTIHRLVTNVQRFLDPAVNAWVGDQPYNDLVDQALPQGNVG